MDAAKNLEKIGLTEKQAKVYFACLQLGVASTLKLSQLAELKRPTVYVILEDLEKLSLVSRVQKNSKTFFIASDPKVLLTRLDLQKSSSFTEKIVRKFLYNMLSVSENSEAPSTKRISCRGLSFLAWR